MPKTATKTTTPAIFTHDEQAAQLEKLAGFIDAAGMGADMLDVAEQWGDYSRDVFGVRWVEVTPPRVAKFCGWLVAAMTEASR